MQVPFLVYKENQIILIQSIMQSIIKNSAKVMLLACVSLIMLTGCSDKKSQLKLGIQIANKQCPIKVGAAGEVTSITFDDKDVIYAMSMDEDYANLEALEKNPESMKSAVSAMFRNPQGDIKKMLDLVVETNSGVKFIYKGKTSGKEVECYLTTEDLKELLNSKMSAKESNQKKLEELVNITNVSCPMTIDEATVMEKLEIEGDNVVYLYKVDEDMVDVDALESNKEEMKQGIKNSLNVADPSLKSFLEACLNDKKNLVYRYTGNTSGNSMECVLEVSEIKELLK